MIAWAASSFRVFERTAVFLSGTSVVSRFTILVHSKPGVAKRATGRQLIGIFCITFIDWNTALPTVNILDGVVDFLDVIRFVADKGGLLKR